MREIETAKLRGCIDRLLHAERKAPGQLPCMGVKLAQALRELEGEGKLKAQPCLPDPCHRETLRGVLVRLAKYFKDLGEELLSDAEEEAFTLLRFGVLFLWYTDFSASNEEEEGRLNAVALEMLQAMMQVEWDDVAFQVFTHSKCIAEAECSEYFSVFEEILTACPGLRCFASFVAGGLAAYLEPGS